MLEREGLRRVSNRKWRRWKEKTEKELGLGLGVGVGFVPSCSAAGGIALAATGGFNSPANI